MFIKGVVAPFAYVSRLVMFGSEDWDTTNVTAPLACSSVSFICKIVKQ